MGFSISLHSSERRSLIYWRMPGLFSSSYSPEGLLLICWCMSCAIAAARLWLPPAAPPVLRHLQLRCTCALCPLLLRASFHHPHLPGGLSLFSCIYPFSSFAPLRRSSCCENKKSGVCAIFFAIADSLLSFQIKNGLPISRFAALLRLGTRFGALQQSLIAKKLQFRAFFCFWDPWIGSNGAAG